MSSNDEEWEGPSAAPANESSDDDDNFIASSDDDDDEESDDALSYQPEDDNYYSYNYSSDAVAPKRTRTATRRCTKETNEKISKVLEKEGMTDQELLGDAVQDVEYAYNTPSEDEDKVGQKLPARPRKVTKRRRRVIYSSDEELVDTESDEESVKRVKRSLASEFEPEDEEFDKKESSAISCAVNRSLEGEFEREDEEENEADNEESTSSVSNVESNQEDESEYEMNMDMVEGGEHMMVHGRNLHTQMLNQRISKQNTTVLPGNIIIENVHLQRMNAQEWTFQGVRGMYAA